VSRLGEIITTRGAPSNHINSKLKFLGKDENHILDIFPTILSTFDVDLPDYVEGVPLLESKTNKEEIKNRLKAMGYV